MGESARTSGIFDSSLNEDSSGRRLRGCEKLETSRKLFNCFSMDRSLSLRRLIFSFFIRIGGPRTISWRLHATSEMSVTGMLTHPARVAGTRKDFCIGRPIYWRNFTAIQISHSGTSDFRLLSRYPQDFQESY